MDHKSNKENNPNVQSKGICVFPVFKYEDTIISYGIISFGQNSLPDISKYYLLFVSFTFVLFFIPIVTLIIKLLYK